MKQGTIPSLNTVLQNIVDLLKEHRGYSSLCAYIPNTSRSWFRVQWNHLGFMQQQEVLSCHQLAVDENLLLEGHSLVLTYFKRFDSMIELSSGEEQQLERLCWQLESAWLREQLHILEPKVEELNSEIANRSQLATDFQQQLKELHEVTIGLSKVACQNELYKAAVEFGIHKLNFDRMAIFLVDPEQNKMCGTWGTDEHGQLRDEHHFKAEIPQIPFVQRALKHRDYVAVWEEAEILDELRVVGKGWNAMVAMWDQDKVFGWIAADNHLRHQPFNGNLKEVFRLYGSALAQLSIRKKAEVQLATLNAELESRVSERTSELTRTNKHLEQEIQERKRTALELTRAREVAEEANRTKSEFLANMSHEIRTPMNAIIGMTDLCLQTSLNTDQYNYLSNINDAAHFLLGILNDVLDFSKAEAGKVRLNRDSFNLFELLDRTVRIIMQLLRNKDIELQFDIDPLIPSQLEGDELRLGQALTNLLSNAAKFTEQGFIALRVRHQLLPAEQVQLLFEVEDSGIGLAEHEQERIFDVFAQADSSTTRKYGGTGLGLSIAKRLIDLMQGSISVRSAPNQGSCFSFDVQLSIASDQPSLVCPEPICLLDCPEQLTQEMIRLEQPLTNYPEQAVAVVSPSIECLSDTDITRSTSAIRVWLSNSDEISSANDKVDLVLAKPWLTFILLSRIQQQLHNNRGSLTPKIKLHQKRILLAEDNRVNQLVVQGLLKDLDLQLDIAENGAVALSMAQRQKYDLILMDCQMPVLDGYEATRRFRRQRPYQHCPIIAMTAHAMAGDREKCIAAGMNDYLTKPLNRTLLINCLAHWLNQGPSQPVSRLVNRA